MSGVGRRHLDHADDFFGRAGKVDEVDVAHRLANPIYAAIGGNSEPYVVERLIALGVAVVRDILIADDRVPARPCRQPACVRSSRTTAYRIGISPRNSGWWARIKALIRLATFRTGGECRSS